MNKIIKMVAEKLNEKLKGKLEWDSNNKVFRIKTNKVFVVIKDFESDWYNFPEIGENLVCASSIESFDKWSRCMYVEQHPLMVEDIERMIKNIERLATPLYVEMSNNSYDNLDNDEIETIYKVANEEKDFYSDILKSCDTIQHNEYIKNLYQHMENCVQEMKDIFSIDFDYKLIHDYEEIDNSHTYDIRHNSKFIDDLENMKIDNDNKDNEKLYNIYMKNVWNNNHYNVSIYYVEDLDIDKSVEEEK